MLNLNSKISDLKGVGDANSKLLGKLGLDTLRDLIFYFPFRYDDFGSSISISQIKADREINISGTIDLIQNRRSWKKKLNITEAIVSDDESSIKVIWFNQAFLTKNLKVGDMVSLAGKATERQGQITLVSPKYEKIDTDSMAPLLNTEGFVPNYHLTGKLTQKQLRSFIKQIIPLVKDLNDPIPDNIKKKFKLLSLQQAIKKIHFPDSREDILLAQQRFNFFNLFLQQLKSQMVKKQLKNRQAIAIEFKEKEIKKFISSLPFKLTDDQKKSTWEIIQDLEKEQPMSRLLEGEVGSGKTLVAVIAMLNVVLNKKQAVLMVPTEILAQQHYQSINKLLKPYELKIGLMTRNNKPKDYNDLDIIIGTHALIQEKVKFNDLALAIVDEQHRFGVSQRKKILDFNKKEKYSPHFLSMTATPIPRSLALAIYGDLDLSIIKQTPIGRKPIITKVAPENKRQAAYNFITKQIEEGRQVFVVCPLVDESDKLGVKSAKEEYRKLSEEIFPDLKIDLIHGKLKAKEKEETMKKFLDNKTNILVASSVIEVGMDVPNANTMVIEGAERFGLAQLHQFRGRVGRSDKQSYCILFPSDDVSYSDKLRTRLDAMTKYNDGFSLAKIDLQLRGAGEVYGIVQSGFPELQMASLFDYELIKKAQTEAQALINNDPNLNKYPLLKVSLSEWEEGIHLE